jgi:flagellar assembly protein FliH
MKSFSKIYSPSAREQLATWIPSELDVEFDIDSTETQQEQILTILRKDENDGSRHEKRAKSILRPLANDLSIVSWQPDEIDAQPLLPEIQTWEFAEAVSEVEEAPAPEPLLNEPDPEKEAEEILKQARLQADEIILDARATADKVIQQAQEEIDLEKKEAYRLGWSEGRNELGAVLDAVRAVVEEVEQWREALTAQGENILVDMLKEIAQTMFGEGVRLDANALQVNLNRVMEHAQKLGDLNIFLSTRDVELLDPSWSEYQLLITGNRVKIIPSEKITPGGCIVKGSMGMVDGRVETQLASIMNTIEEIRGSKE